MPPGDLVVRVCAPSRLHFGLLAYADAAPRQFGGVGVMIEQPCSEIVVELPSAPRESAARGSPASARAQDLPRTPSSLDARDRARREAAERRAAEFGRRFVNSLEPGDSRERLAQARVRVLQTPPAHVGLGSGTQLAMCVARALAMLAGRADMPPEELARRVGRGARSAIGVHGFHRGGFLVEAGKRDDASIAPLVARVDFPADWHFLLMIPANSQGVHGAAEREAFDRLPPISDRVTADLCRLTLLGMLPALVERDFTAFSDALCEFGRKVGECFAAIQGGVYSSPLAKPIIEQLEREGIRGVAQSSWGPTLCAVTDSRPRAEWLAGRLRQILDEHDVEVRLTAASNSDAATSTLT